MKNPPANSSPAKKIIAKSILTCTQTLSCPPKPLVSTPISKAEAKLQRLFTSSNQNKYDKEGCITENPKNFVAVETSPVWNCAWSHNGSLLATCHGAPDSCIRLWKINNERKEWTVHATLSLNDDENTVARTVRSVVFAPTPPNVRYILAAASFDGTISIWEQFSSNDNDNISNNGWECTAQLEGHENEVKDVTWNEMGSLLASCGRDKTVWIWETFLPGSIGGSGTGNSNGYLNNGANNNHTGGDFECECLAVLHGHSQDVKEVVFAPSHGQWGDGDEILLSASYDDTIKCWAEDAGDWFCALTLSNTVHTSTIWSVALSPSGVRMISGSADQSLAIWKCYTAEEKKKMNLTEEEEGINSRDGFWKCVGRLPYAHKQAIYSVDCAPSIAGHGRIASCGGDQCINIYREVRSGGIATMGSSDDSPQFVKDASVQNAHEGDVNCIRWHPLDGKKLASVGDDGLVKIWRYTM